MAVINLIRHGETAGNRKKRYIGTTDETLCEESWKQLLGKTFPAADAWFVSPMKRCLETAAAADVFVKGGPEGRLPEGMDPETLVAGFLEKENRILVPDFRECDFGLFENKNFLELSGCPEYQTWIESGGTLPFPGGEAVDQFKERCCLAFEKMVDQIFRKGWSAVNVVVHGGTIMSIMERYARPEKSYYEWHVENGRGYTLLADYGRWKEEKQMNYCIRF